MLSNSVGVRAIPVSIINMICQILLYLNVKYFIRKKSKNVNLPPVIFGRYQRNVMTYKQIILVVFIMFLFNLRFPIYTLLTGYVKFQFDFRPFILLSTICDDLIFSLIFPIYILVTISKDFPDFFDNTLSTRENVAKFYIHQQNFAPRDPKIENTFDINAQKLRFNRIFLQEMNAKNDSSSKRCIPKQNNTITLALGVTTEEKIGLPPIEIGT